MQGAKSERNLTGKQQEAAARLAEDCFTDALEITLLDSVMVGLAFSLCPSQRQDLWTLIPTWIPP